MVRGSDHPREARLDAMQSGRRVRSTVLAQGSDGRRGRLKSRPSLGDARHEHRSRAPNVRQSGIRKLWGITRPAASTTAGTALPVGDPDGGSLDLKSDTSLLGHGEHGGQVAITPMIHTAVARRTDMSSTSIETPTARRAAFVDGQAIRGPTRWSSDK